MELDFFLPILVNLSNLSTSVLATFFVTAPPSKPPAKRTHHSIGIYYNIVLPMPSLSTTVCMTAAAAAVAVMMSDIEAHAYTIMGTFDNDEMGYSTNLTGWGATACTERGRYSPHPATSPSTTTTSTPSPRTLLSTVGWVSSTVPMATPPSTT